MVSVDLASRLSNPDFGLVFHYTSLKALKGIFHTGKIRFGHLSHTNDPYERDIWDISPGLWGGSDEEVIKSLIEADTRIHTIHDWCQLFCTTRDSHPPDPVPYNTCLLRGFTIPSLWAQYASDHKGVCLVFDKDNLIKSIHSRAEQTKDHVFCNEVSYNGPPYPGVRALDLDLTGRCHQIKKALHKYILDNYETLFFKKDPSWTHENEFRFLVVCHNKKRFEINISGCIVGVVLGAQFPTCYDSLIINACHRYGIGSAKIVWEFGWPTVYQWPG